MYISVCIFSGFSHSPHRISSALFNLSSSSYFLHFVTCSSLPCHPLMIYLKLQLKDTVHKLTGPHLYLKCRALKPQASVDINGKEKEECGAWTLCKTQILIGQPPVILQNLDIKQSKMEMRNGKQTSLCDDPPWPSGGPQSRLNWMGEDKWKRTEISKPETTLLVSVPLSCESMKTLLPEIAFSFKVPNFAGIDHCTERWLDCY